MLWRILLCSWLGPRRPVDQQKVPMAFLIAKAKKKTVASPFLIVQKSNKGAFKENLQIKYTKRVLVWSVVRETSLVVQRLRL